MTETKLPNIVLPAAFNYIAVFLTFACTLRCTYCINHHGGDLVKGRKLDGDDWIRGLNRLTAREDLPITIQGGEPTVHRDFYKIVNGIRNDTHIDLLTNLEVDWAVFKSNIEHTRLKRNAPYASIRVSYHHGQSDFTKTIERVSKLQESGFSIGIWEVGHPEYLGDVYKRQSLAVQLGIDYRIKEFLGPHKGEVLGTFRYEEAVDSTSLRHCDCRTSELLIAPDGGIFRCHSDLYANRYSVGHILDPNYTGASLGQWSPCAVYGKCNSCDIKVKYDRFQKHGHSSVEIRNISASHAKNTQYVTHVVNTYGKQDAIRTATYGKPVTT